MFTKLYFCVFCPLKTTEENNLKAHIFKKHFDGTEDKLVLKKWIDSLANYQKELNDCLSSDPKSLPKSSMCQSGDQNNSKQKLLKGCLFCDKIIDCFKLDVIPVNKRRNQCICGFGTEINKVVVKCNQCKHLYHYQCVEPTGYSGEETSLYKCYKCKEKDFEISDLSSESKISQPLHVSHHFNYQPFVCNLCKDSYFRQSFLKTHLKNEHNLKPNDTEITKYYSNDSILKVQQLIDNCLKKLDQNNSNNQLNGHLSTQSTSKHRRSAESSVHSMKNKRLRTIEDNQSFNLVERNELRRSKEQTTTRFQSNVSNMTPSRTPVAHRTDPSLSSPPILINQKTFNNSTERDNSQMPKKRGRGRPRKSETTIKKRPKPQSPKPQSNGSTLRTFITPNSYVADGNPQHKSRLSKESRLSRPNISLSREQEKALHNKTNIKSTHKQYNKGEDSSDWDSDIESFETNLHSKRISETSGNQNSQNESRPQSFGSISSDTNQRIRSVPNVVVPNKVQNQVIDSNTEVLTNDEQMDEDIRADPTAESTQSEAMAVQTNVNSISVGPNNPISVLSKDWLTHTNPKKFPYFPQINDEVVYIPYGHKAYMETVQKDNLYRQYNNKYINSHLNEFFYAKVKEIEFKTYSNIRLAKLNLTLFGTESEAPRPLIVKFHDIDNVVDFIVLKQIYKNSIERNWKIGDSFRAIIEDKWWFGDIQDYSSEEHNTKTHFQCLKIIWGNGSHESLSYWDLEPIVGQMPENKSDSIDVTDEDRNQFYVSDPNEWPSNGKSEECKRILKGLNQIIKLKEYKQLIEVFDPSNQEFVDEVSYPINLDIIRKRVQNMFYRRHAAIKYDIKFLESNASILQSKQESDVLRNAQIVVSVCLKFIDDLEATDIKHIYNKVMSEPNNLSKIKYYACVRSHQKPNFMTANTVQQNGRQLNLLTPSTSNTRVNTIRMSDDNEIPIIDLSDSDEDNNEEDSHQRIERLVEQMEEHIVSPTAPDSPSPRPLPKSPKTLPKTPKPVVPVRALPIEPVEEQPPQEASNLIYRYFCVFCEQKFVDKNEAKDHFWSEFKIKLKCSHCPQNSRFQTYDQLFDHNPEHIKVLVDPKSYKNIKDWIQNMIGFMDNLKNLTIQSEIHKNFGDFCNVCKGLNVMTADSQPLFHKSVFSNNRKALNFKIRTEISTFAQHLRQHLQYNPYYYCIQCTLIKAKCDVFKCDEIDDKCCQHLKNEHQMQCESPRDTNPFFGDTIIPNIKDLISDLTNKCLVNCSNY